MKILILAAMEKELALMTSILDDKKTTYIDDKTPVVEGRIGNKEVFIAKCGIGKVNSAINSFKLINTLHPDIVINSGVAGGAGLPIGCLLVADKIAYSDVWCGPGSPYGQADGFPLFFTSDAKVLKKCRENLSENYCCYGLICSSDKFISTAEEIAFIRSHFPEVKAVDMESASIGQVCYMTQTPLVVLRVVSDTPGEGENISQYKNFWEEAPLKTFSAIGKLIENI